MKPIACMVYNAAFDVVVSADQGGMIEYWSGPKGDYQMPKNVDFESKLDTDLYEFAKNKTFPLTMSVSKDGKFLATFGADRKIRVKMKSLLFWALIMAFFVGQNQSRVWTNVNIWNRGSGRSGSMNLFCGE